MTTFELQGFEAPEGLDPSPTGQAPTESPGIPGQVAPASQEPPAFDPTQLSAYIEARSTSEALQNAYGAGDRSEIDALLDQQRQQAGMASLQVMMEGGDPLYETRPVGSMVDPEIEIQRRLMHHWDRDQQVRQTLEEQGFGEVKAYMQGIAARYRAQNESRMIADPKTDEEFAAQVEQMAPVELDPNEIADMRHRVVKIDQALKQIDPKLSVWTHPETQPIVEWINREAGDGGVGFLRSGEQEMDLGVAGSIAMVGVEALEGAEDFGLNMIYGGWDLADRAVQALGGGGLGSPPTNYTLDEDGKIVTNSAKVPGFMEASMALWATVTGENVAESIASLNRAREMEVANRSGFQDVVYAASKVAGMSVGFGVPASASARAGAALARSGKLQQKGLNYLGSLGLKGAQSERALKITNVLSKTAGAMAVQGAQEAIAYGRHEGFSESFMAGAMMTPVLMALGSMGQGVERILRQRAKMPKRMAHTISGAVEGMGFGTLQASQNGAVWDFLKDPSEETFKIYASNMLGFMLGKNVGYRLGTQTPGEGTADAVLGQTQARHRRSREAEQFAKEPVREVELEPLVGQPERVNTESPREAAMRELGAASKELRSSRSLEENRAAKQKVDDAHTRMDVEDYNLDSRLDRDLRHVDDGGLSAPTGGEDNPFRGLGGVFSGRQKLEATLREQINRRGSERSREMLRDFDRADDPTLSTGELGMRSALGERGRLDAPDVMASRLDDGRRSNLPASAQVPPTRQVEGSAEATPTRAGDIFTEMSGRPSKEGFRVPLTSVRLGAKSGDPVKTDFRAGRVTKGAEGVFKFHENLVRTKEGRDLVVGAHEWSHALHRQVLGEPGQGMLRAAREQRARAEASDPNIVRDVEAIGESYPGFKKLSPEAQWMEAWSEWHARNLLNEPGLDTQYPAFSNWARSFMAQPAQARYRDQYQRIQGMLYDYNTQGSRERVRQSKVLDTAKETATEKATKKGRFAAIRDRINKHLFDDMSALKDRQDVFLRNNDIDPETISIMDDPARLGDAMRMTAGKQAEHFIRKGFTLPDGTKVKGLEEIMKGLKGREEDFVDYLISVKSAQMLKRGKKAQLPMQDYVETLRQLQTENPDFRAKARELKQWADALIDEVARAGNLDPDQAQKIKDSYAVYVPMFRVLPESARFPGQRIGGGNALHGQKGSTYEIRDPLMAMQEVARNMIAKAQQNMVTGALYRFSARAEAGGLATVIPKTRVPQEHPTLSAINALKNKAKQKGASDALDVLDSLADVDGLNDESITLFTQKTFPTGERNVVAFTPRMSDAEVRAIARDDAHFELLKSQQGKVQWLEVDPVAYESLMGLNTPAKVPALIDNPLVRGATLATRTFATGMNPAFVVKNMVRDAVMRPIFTAERKGMVPGQGFVDMAVGAARYFESGGSMREIYDQLGVKTSSFFSEGQRRKIAGQHRRFADRVHDTLDKIQNVMGTPENFLRMKSFSDAYQGAKAAGKSEVEARMLALEAGRESMVNFARAGISSRIANQAVPYFNANLQGKRKLWRQIAGGGDAKGDKAKARVQRQAIVNAVAQIGVPSAILALMNQGQEWYEDLPEWRKINYWNVNIFGEILSIPKPFEAGVIFGSTIEMAVDENPATAKEMMKASLSGYLDGIGAFIPALIKPIVEQTTNYDLFRDRAITPEYLKRTRVSEEQSTFYTTETAKILSQAVNGVLSPIEIEHMLGGYTAGAAVSGMKVIDDIAATKEHTNIWRDISPIGSFVKQEAHGSSRAVNELYDLSEELDQKAGSDRLDAAGTALRTRVNRAKSQLSSIRKQYQAGRISRDEANRRSYEVAKPFRGRNP